MRIIVCVKQIAYTYARSGRDVAQHYLSDDDVVCRINPMDEQAIGLALAVGGLAGSARISLLTLGPLIAETELRRCAALGAHEIYHLDTTASLDPWQKAHFLARAVSKIGCDLVLCGLESLDTRHGQVGALLGARLNYPYVSGIREVQEAVIKSHLVVERAAGRGKRERVRASLPLVCSVEAGKTPLPIPTWEGLERSRSLPIQKLFLDESAASPRLVRTHLGPPRPRPKAPPGPDSRLNAHERTRQLLTGSRVEKKGEMLSGDPAQQVEGIISFLEANDFLKQAQQKTKG